jgi:catechol 2,3-dioxygenase-like lactoylglutathione lyase family enzyme
MSDPRSRCRLPWRAAGLLTVLLLATAAARGGEPESKPLVEAVGPVGLTVRDMDASVAFYTDVLAFEKVAEMEVAGEAYEKLTGVFGVRMRVVRLKLGDEALELTEYLAPRGRAYPAESRSNDRWFQHVAIIVSDMDAAYKRLRRHKVEHASTGPQTLPKSNLKAGGIRAFYFKDPDGHALEVLEFPPDKGDARWHRKSDRLFLGIDHTAIVVRDTDASLRFYRDTLGLRVVGESENFGTEQEHLNNVAGARLRITTLRAAKGPGVELLEYLAPRDGREMPRDTKANDLWRWQPRLRVNDPSKVPDRLRAEKVRVVFDGLTTLPDDRLGFAQGVMARDPDGHAILLSDR